MADMKVNVDRVVTAANNIKTLNNQMKNAFSDVQNAMTRLNSSWDGSASTQALSKFDAIKNSYCDARYNVLDNFVAYLHQQVGQGYTQTEAVNKSLADQFK